MRYRPPSKRGRPSFIPTPKPATLRPTQVSIRKRRPHIHPPNFKESAAHSRRTQTQTSIRRRPSPNASLTLVRKKASPHDKKYVISRAQTFFLVNAKLREYVRRTFWPSQMPYYQTQKEQKSKLPHRPTDAPRVPIQHRPPYSNRARPSSLS